MVLPKRHQNAAAQVHSSITKFFREGTEKLGLLGNNKKKILRQMLLVALVVILLLRIQKKRPYYYGPPIDVFLKLLPDPLSTTTDLQTCVSTIRASASLAVIVVGSSRADYLQQVLDSLHHQSVQTFHVYIFLDYCTMTECDQVVTLVEKVVQENSGRYQYQRAAENIGIARMTYWAIDTVLKDANHRWERFLFLEDDHLLGYTYVEAMGMLLQASENMPKVAVVNGNFADTPAFNARGQHYQRRPYWIKERDKNCQFQIVEPMHANTDVNGHDLWGWATTRKKYETMMPTWLEAFRETKLDIVSYMERNRSHIAHVMDKYCSGSGYQQWGGQDWLRACIFFHHGMTQKLQPTSRLMTYIGMRGLHMQPEVFNASGFDPVPVAQVSKNVSLYPNKLCGGSICTFKVVETFDRWAWLRKRRKKSLG